MVLFSLAPFYQGSYSGVLKNALDNLAYDAFLSKLVGLISPC
ncbi:NAD(P)H-dependent oxidoreductase [Bartonella callosciuri]|nr:NAD(P)H-dependent oxidoreductase [Bartonella callosciuri]